MNPLGTKSVLLLSPAFMADRRHKRIHGTEVFNFLFIRQLVEAGYRVTLTGDPAWRAGFEEHLSGVPRAEGGAGAGLSIVYGLPLKRPLPSSLSVLPRLMMMPAHDLLVVGNVARGILPAVWALQRAGKARRTVVIAHQNPKERFLRGLRRIRCEIQAVSGPVAERIRRLSDVPVWVSYGVLNGHLFYPREGAGDGRLPGADGPVRFGVVGQLDTPWKGARLALEAWACLPDDVRRGAELHLCAYADPPRVNDPSIVMHRWKRVEEVGPFMRTLDVLIVPSTSSETFSQVMVQGMLTGLPILAYRLDVLTEKLDTGGGLVFSTPGELAGHIADLCRSTSEIRRMGQIARRTALDRYVWRLDAFTRRYLGDA